MTRKRIWFGGLGVAAVAVLSACGSGSPSAQVASLAEGQSGGATTTIAATSQSDTQQAMLDFAQCMREHGVDMPDPQFGENGQASFTVGAEGTPADKSKLDAAQAACQSYLDKVKSNAPPLDPAKIEAEKQKLLDFAQCMRDHGIDFPDPQISTDGGGLQVQMGGPGVDPSSPGFKEANDTCSAQVGLPKPGDGGSNGGGMQIATGGSS
jgi:hypothetical protein